MYFNNKKCLCFWPFLVPILADLILLKNNTDRQLACIVYPSSPFSSVVLTLLSCSISFTENFLPVFIISNFIGVFYTVNRLYLAGI
jgi:hypothetical protein